MFSSITFTALLASVFVAVRADPNPNSPGPGDVFNEGAACPIGWGVDASGKWTAMKIQLMTGDNFNMVALETVATVDATDATNNTYSWTCPQVSPNSAIYFYQFTGPDPADPNNLMWTTRFTIADKSGASTPPSQTTQPNGAPTPWGTGQLASGSGAGSSGAATGTTALTASSSVATVAPASSTSTVSSASSSATSTPLSMQTVATSSTGSSSAPTASHTSAASGNSTNAAVSLDGHMLKTALVFGAAVVGISALL